MTSTCCIWLTILSLFVSLSTSEQTEESQPANILFVMLDDLGRSDIGYFGAEWDTPNIDSFIESSVTLSHHYIGYVCSASRSQFLTGRYSFHNGYGTLNVFDIEKTGAIPQSTPTIMEYLKFYSSYSTYGIGKWQLGSPTYSHLAGNRGFDSFFGFNGGLENYFTKERSKIGDTYTDFWQDLEPATDENVYHEYSTDQYMSKIINIIDKHADGVDQHGRQKEPFFIYAGFQAIHKPFPSDETNEWTEYYSICKDNYNSKMANFNERIGVCEAMIGIDSNLGDLFSHFQSSDKLKAVWDNTVIIFTSDNGGSIDSGSCNYPLRGGKNTYYEGSQRVLAVVGGGKIPDPQRGSILDGLVSNVDWFPTMLSFANVVSPDNKYLTFRNELVNMQLDGYNMYDYIMKPNTDALRDHILFHITPTTEDDSNNKLVKEIGKYDLNDIEEIAMIFYDKNGMLWKYFNADLSENPIGNPIFNSGWCTKNEDRSVKKDIYITDVESSYAETIGLYNVAIDMSERYNYLGDDTEFERLEEFSDLFGIVNDKVRFYVNHNNEGSQNGKYLFGDFDCFTDDSTHVSKLIKHAQTNGAWVPFMSDSELEESYESDCGLPKEHPIYQLLTTPWATHADMMTKTFDGILKSDGRTKIEEINNYIPDMSSQRKLDVNLDYKEIDGKTFVFDTASVHTKTIQVPAIGGNSLMNIFLVSAGFVSIFVGFGVVVAIIACSRQSKNGKLGDYSPLV